MHIAVFCMYVNVSVCIEFSQELYPVHICMYVHNNKPTSMLTQSDMHLKNSAYLNVFNCIIVYIHIHIHHDVGVYLNVSECILQMNTVRYEQH
jgi:hypothetical protein